MVTMIGSRNRRMVSSSRGYTVVELLVVITVIAILAGLSVVTYGNVQANGRDAERDADMLSVKSQLESYFNDNGTYPIASVMSNSVATTIAGSAGILSGLSADALVSPNASSGTTNSIVAASATGNPANSVYWYQAYQSNGTTVCSTVPCAKFKLMYTKENAQIITLSSIN